MGTFCLFKNTYYAPYFQFYLRGWWFKTLKILGKLAFLVKKRGVFNGSFCVQVFSNFISAVRGSANYCKNYVKTMLVVFRIAQVPLLYY